MTRTLVLRLIVEVPDERKTHLSSNLPQVLEGAARHLRGFEIKVLGKEAVLSMPTKEESVRLIPKKIHFGRDGFSVCGREQLPQSRLVQSWSKVDCLFCLKQRPADAAPQGDLFR